MAIFSALGSMGAAIGGAVGSGAAAVGTQGLAAVQQGAQYLGATAAGLGTEIGEVAGKVGSEIGLEGIGKAAKQVAGTINPLAQTARMGIDMAQGGPDDPGPGMAAPTSNPMAGPKKKGTFNPFGGMPGGGGYV